jgi:hypothetical protein
MKTNSNKLLVVIAIAALIVMSTVLISCGFSGTYRDGNNYITFQGKNIVMKYRGQNLSGTWTKVGDTLTVGNQMGWSMTFTIIDSKTLQREDPAHKAIWKK